MQPSIIPPSSVSAPVNPGQSSVASTIRGLAGRRPSGVWCRAAVALLRDHLEECEAVALVFEDATVTDEVRMLALDLLAGAGTFEAQVILRRLLALGVSLRDSRMFATFVQRLAMIDRPDGPTLRFLMSVYGSSGRTSNDVRARCAYALGAASGRALATGDWEAAITASDALRRDLPLATTVDDTCALLAALGNAGIASDAPAILRFTHDPGAAVRAAAALALRKLRVAEASRRLVFLVTDREPNVAQSALAALSEHELDHAHMDRLAEHVVAGRTAPNFDAQVLALMVAQPPRDAGARSGSIDSALRILLGRVEVASTATPEGRVEVASTIKPEVPGSGVGRQTFVRAVEVSPAFAATAGAAVVSTRTPTALADAKRGSGAYPMDAEEVAAIMRARLSGMGVDPDALLGRVRRPPAGAPPPVHPSALIRIR